jgi:hypothetical protein
MNQMVRRQIALALLACGWWASVQAQETEFLYRGYVEGVYDRYRLNGEAAANPGNRIGLPLAQRELVLDVVGSVSRGPLKAVVEGYGRAAHHGSSERQLRAHQAYVAASSEDDTWYVRVGKIVPSWGVGQIWNPVRALTNEGRRDLVMPNRAVEGIRLAQVQRTLSLQSSVSVLLLPGEDERSDGYALRFSSALAGFDYAASVYGNSSGDRRAGLEMSWIIGRMSVVGELAWANRSVAQVVQPDGRLLRRTGNAGISYVLGVNMALPGDRQLTTEYFHDAEAFDRTEFGDFARTLPASFSLYKPLGNGRDTVYIGMTQSILRNNSSVGLGMFRNIQSGVTVLRVSAETQLWSDARLLLTASRYREPCCGPAVNVYDATFDARVRWSF